MVDERHSDMASSSLGTAVIDKTRIGRPSTSAQPGGQQTIIASMQKFMRFQPFTNVQRLQIAEYAGVTPALISYYFPEKLDLIIASASPLVSTYIHRIRQILSDSSDLLADFRSLGYEFISFNHRSGHALDYYIDATMRRQRGDEMAEMSRQYGELFSFMKEVIEKRSSRIIDPAFLHSSLWAQCKYLGRQPHLLTITDQNEAEIAIRSLSDETFKLFTKGLLD